VAINNKIEYKMIHFGKNNGFQASQLLIDAKFGTVNNIATDIQESKKICHR